VTVQAPGGWLVTDDGYHYRDPLRSFFGTSALDIESTDPLKGSIALKASGSLLPRGILPATSYTVQLIDETSGSCWESVFLSAHSSAHRFQARIRN
jgi:hypothetical protein